VAFLHTHTKKCITYTKEPSAYSIPYGTYIVNMTTTRCNHKHLVAQQAGLIPRGFWLLLPKEWIDANFAIYSH